MTITPSTQMGEGWAMAVAEGKRNVNGRRLLFFEPEGEHAAAAVTAGMSMVGLRATNFSSGQGIAYMHESLYAAVGKRLTYVLNIAARTVSSGRLIRRKWLNSSTKSPRDRKACALVSAVSSRRALCGPG